MPHTREAHAPIRDAQGELPLSRETRLSLLRRCRFDRPGRRAPFRLNRLLEEIELTTCADGCRLTVQVLAWRLGVTDRTARRWLREAEDLGVLCVEPNPEGIGGCGPSRYSIVWDKVRQHAPAELLSGRADNSGALLSGRPDMMTGRPDNNAAAGMREDRRGEALPSSSLNSKKEKENCSSSPSLELETWEQVTATLIRLGIRDTRGTVEGATRRGWTAAQALALVQSCEAESCGPETKFQPGAVAWQLTDAPPGAPMNFDPRAEWKRARAAERDAARVSAERAESAARPAAKRAQHADRERREARYGKTLDEWIAQGRTGELLEGTGIKPQFANRDVLLSRLEQRLAGGSAAASRAGGQSGGAPAGGG